METGSVNIMKIIHGGDIYRNQVNLDFSVNINPLGIPREVEEALHGAVRKCGEYPDIAAERLREAVSRMLSVPEEYLLFGNGASELFMAAVHGMKPEKTVIPVPSFYGYEYAAGAASENILYYGTKRKNGFCLGEDFFEFLTEDVDLLFLANPNNPTGNLMDREYLARLLEHCGKRGIYVVLDECFIEFCGEGHSALPQVSRFDNLILVRAFTKIFAIPGVRLGYLVCGNRQLLEGMNRHLPEWNLSVFAQAAGYVCAKQDAYVAETADYVKEERFFLADGLKNLGFTVFDSMANFILFYTTWPLYNPLLERGILIRDCSNFKGLSEGFYRVAVKSRKESEILLKELGRLR